MMYLRGSTSCASRCVVFCWFTLVTVVGCDDGSGVPGSDVGGSGNATSGNGSSGGSSNSTATSPNPATGGTSTSPNSSTAGGDSSTGQGGGSTPATTATSVDIPRIAAVGTKLQDPTGKNVVLRGVSTIDLGSTEQWEGGLKKMIDRLTNQSDTQGSSPGWYPTVFRLAIYPADSQDADSPQTYQQGSDSFYDQLLRPIVDYIKQKRAYAIIDWHYIGDTSSHRNTTSQFWTYMAPKFANDAHVIYELYNEPVNGGSWSNGLKADMQSWYDIVRQAAPDTLVLVGTPNWCQNVSQAANSPLNAANVAYVGHMYPMHWASQSLRNEIGTAAAKVPVFLTEWGFEKGSNDIVDGDVNSYGKPFKQFVDNLGLSWTGWCASSSWFPRMFDTSYKLLVGDNYMGGFLKDWLYEKRDSDKPTGL